MTEESLRFRNTKKRADQDEPPVSRTLSRKRKGVFGKLASQADSMFENAIRATKTNSVQRYNKRIQNLRNQNEALSVFFEENGLTQLPTPRPARVKTSQKKKIDKKKSYTFSDVIAETNKLENLTNTHQLKEDIHLSDIISAQNNLRRMRRFKFKNFDHRGNRRSITRDRRLLVRDMRALAQESLNNTDIKDTFNTHDYLKPHERYFKGDLIENSVSFEEIAKRLEMGKTKHPSMLAFKRWYEYKDGKSILSDTSSLQARFKVAAGNTANAITHLSILPFAGLLKTGIFGLNIAIKILKTSLNLINHIPLIAGKKTLFPSKVSQFLHSKHYIPTTDFSWQMRRFMKLSPRKRLIKDKALTRNILRSRWGATWNNIGHQHKSYRKWQAFSAIPGAYNALRWIANFTYFTAQLPRTIALPIGPKFKITLPTVLVAALASTTLNAAQLTKDFSAQFERDPLDLSTQLSMIPDEDRHPAKFCAPGYIDSLQHPFTLQQAAISYNGAEQFRDNPNSLLIFDTAEEMFERHGVSSLPFLANAIETNWGRDTYSNTGNARGIQQMMPLTTYIYLQSVGQDVEIYQERKAIYDMYQANEVNYADEVNGISVADAVIFIASLEEELRKFEQDRYYLNRTFYRGERPASMMRVLDIRNDPIYSSELVALQMEKTSPDLLAVNTANMTEEEYVQAQLDWYFEHHFFGPENYSNMQTGLTNTPNAMVGYGMTNRDARALRDAAQANMGRTDVTYKQFMDFMVRIKTPYAQQAYALTQLPENAVTNATSSEQIMFNMCYTGNDDGSEIPHEINTLLQGPSPWLTQTGPAVTEWLNTNIPLGDVNANGNTPLAQTADKIGGMVQRGYDDWNDWVSTHPKWNKYQQDDDLRQQAVADVGPINPVNPPSLKNVESGEDVREFLISRGIDKDTYENAFYRDYGQGQFVIHTNALAQGELSGQALDDMQYVLGNALGRSDLETVLTSVNNGQEILNEPPVTEEYFETVMQPIIAQREVLKTNETEARYQELLSERGNSVNGSPLAPAAMVYDFVTDKANQRAQIMRELRQSDPEKWEAARIFNPQALASMVPFSGLWQGNNNTANEIIRPLEPRLEAAPLTVKTILSSSEKELITPQLMELFNEEGFNPDNYSRIPRDAFTSQLEQAIDSPDTQSMIDVLYWIKSVAGEEALAYEFADAVINGRSDVLSDNSWQQWYRNYRPANVSSFASP